MKTKNIKKNTNPTMIVDLTNVKSPADISDAFILAKIHAGMPISDVDFLTAKLNTIDRMVEAVNTLANDLDVKTTYINDDKLAKKLMKEIDKALNKKQPWYKRFWNWLKNPFVKKK